MFNEVGMWPDVDKQVNYPMKCQLCEIQREEDVDLAHPVISKNGDDDDNNNNTIFTQH